MTSSLRSLNSSYHENLSSILAAADNSMQQSTDSGVDALCGIVNGGGGGDLSAITAIRQKSKEDYERLQKQFKVFVVKQEQLLCVAFYLLLNIAENVRFEEKMRKKHIVRLLVRAMERQNADLLILVVTFLKKLSIVKDNKDDMYELNVVDRLPKLLQINNSDLIQLTLKFIFNLSFDGTMRAKMIRMGLLSKLVAFLSDDKHHGIVIRILYHMSLDDKVKSMFTYTECIPLATDMLILNLNQKADTDLIALCINLALNKRNAELMTDNNRLHTLMSRAFKYQDALLMKMIRNISHHEQLRVLFVVRFGFFFFSFCIIKQIFASAGLCRRFGQCIDRV